MRLSTGAESYGSKSGTNLLGLVVLSIELVDMPGLPLLDDMPALPFCTAADFTVIVRDRQPARLVAVDTFAVDDLSYAGDVRMSGPDDGPAKGRALCCSCFKGQATSLTVRWSPPDRPSENAPKLNLREWTAGRTGYQPSPKRDGLNNMEEICRILYDTVFVRGPRRQRKAIPLANGDDNTVTSAQGSQPVATASRESRAGLVVVTGSTNSGKSSIARGLIHLYLESALAEWTAAPTKLRKPHLVTYEDPIEQDYVDLRTLAAGGDMYMGWSQFVDYTPRQLLLIRLTQQAPIGCG